MELSKRMLLPAAMALFFLLVASEMGTTMVEGRLCESQSHRFVGPCVREANCASVCHTEGFHGGVCRGHLFHRKCYCTRPC